MSISSEEDLPPNQINFQNGQTTVPKGWKKSRQKERKVRVISYYHLDLLSKLPVFSYLYPSYLSCSLTIRWSFSSKNQPHWKIDLTKVISRNPNDKYYKDKASNNANNNNNNSASKEDDHTKEIDYEIEFEFSDEVIRLAREGKK